MYTSAPVSAVQITASSNAIKQHLHELHSLYHEGKSSNLATIRCVMINSKSEQFLIQCHFEISALIAFHRSTMMTLVTVSGKNIKAHQVHKQAFIPGGGGGCKTSNSASHSQQVSGPMPPSTVSHRKLSNSIRKVGTHCAPLAKRPHQRPTFLLFEGLDGARVVHHCDVQLVPSVNRTPYFKKQSCSVHGRLWCGCVGVPAAPILPNDLTADAQTKATPV